MAADHSLKNALRMHLRRKHRKDLTGLHKLAEETFAAATETVTLTSLSAEGGAQSGQITCPRGLLLEVLEELIAELDPSAPRDSAWGAITSR